MVPDFVPGLCPVRLENSEESMYILYIVVGGYVKYLYAQKDWIGLPVNHLVAGSNPAAGAIFIAFFRLVQLKSLFWWNRT